MDRTRRTNDSQGPPLDLPRAVEGHVSVAGTLTVSWRGRHGLGRVGS